MPSEALDETAPVGKGYLAPRLRLYGCPLPLPDESLSSWLIRVSTNFILPVKDIIEYCFGAGLKQLFSADPDVVLIEGIQQSLASKLGKSPDTFLSVASLTPRQLGWPSESWLVANLNYSRHVSAFCTQCLASDIIPYFRNQWRYTAAQRCLIHGCSLLRKCPHCHFPVHPYRHRPGILRDMRILSTCPYCLNDLNSPATGESYFTKMAKNQQFVPVTVTKPFPMNPPRKKPPRKKKSAPEKPQSIAPRSVGRSAEPVAVLDLDIHRIGRKSDIEARYKLCLYNPKFRAHTILQELEHYYEQVAEEVTKRGGKKSEKQ